jgi:FdhD protein
MRSDEGTKRAGVVHVEAGSATESGETLVVEAPLHIRLNGVAYTTTMRTPGADVALARGLLFTEGIVPNPRATLSYRETTDPESGWVSLIEVACPEEFVAKSVEGRRTMIASASCGVCGTREPADLAVYGTPLSLRAGGGLDIASIDAMRDTMRSRQPIFGATGGCHAAALFDARRRQLAVCEDVGRHNAVDKTVGTVLASGKLDEASVLFVSGRVSYEIVYKAYRASVPVLLAVSAASSLAVETADRLGITVAGFCRDGRATVYCHPERIAAKADAPS